MSFETNLRSMVYSSSLPSAWREPVYRVDLTYNFADNVPWYYLDDATIAAKGGAARTAVRSARNIRSQEALNHLAYILNVPAFLVTDVVSGTVSEAERSVGESIDKAKKVLTDWGPIMTMVAAGFLGMGILIFVTSYARGRS